MSTPTKENKSSKLLSQEENQLVFSLLGKKCLSQSTSVVEVFLADPPHHSQWTRFGIGVLCFIKDSVKRSYFMRLYCLKWKKSIWEQEIYDELVFCRPRPYLVVFESNPSIIALNFVNESEAEKFAMLLQRYLDNRKKKKIMNQKSIKPRTYVDETFVKKIPDVVVKSEVKVKKRPGLTKKDIGAPTNFVHLESGTHGFNKPLDSPNSPNNDGQNKRLSEFLQQAGVTPRMLNNRKTREAVQSFIEDNQVLEKIQGHNSRVSRPAPKLPASPKHPSSPKLSHAPPIPERPRTYVDNSVVNPAQNILAPPPPPLPPLILPDPFNTPLTPIGENSVVTQTSDRADLLSEIHKGFQLKPTEIKESPRTDTRGDLLLQIQRGQTLKPVKDRRDDSPRPKDEPHDLAKAMHEALNVILTANHNSSDEEVDDTFDDWDD